MSNESEKPTPSQVEATTPHELLPVDGVSGGDKPLEVVLQRVNKAITLSDKADALWELTAEVRHETLGTLPASLIAALVETDPERNTALLANIPAAKFQQVLNLGTPLQGRQWLERAVESGSLAAAILPSLLTSRDLADMLLTSVDVRRALPTMLNFKRAERWRRLLSTSEWNQNVEDLLLSDVDELLAKINFKNKPLKAVLQSLVDFVPELYLETVRLALDRAKYAEDRPDEFEHITETPFGMPELNQENDVLAAAPISTPEEERDSPLAELMPEDGDPVFALATAGLTSARKALLEEQLRHLLRQEIVATASFAQENMNRAAGRVMFYLRVGLESFGSSVEDTTRALELRNLNEISAIGARAAESYRQKALALSGMKDWLDSRQRQFLESMRQPEAGLHPETREPILWLASKPKQDRAEWFPTPVAEVSLRLTEIADWAPLARAAFRTPERVHIIFTTAKTRTAAEALKRTVLALALYRRWEPELVRPDEDLQAFARQYLGANGAGMDALRNIVLDALEATPDALWKPSDAKLRARKLLLNAVDSLEGLTWGPPQKKRTHP